MTTPNLTPTNNQDANARPLRLREVNRDDVASVPARLEDLLPKDHLARLLWNAVGYLNLMAFYAHIKVVKGGPGAPAIDPRVLVTLWLYATSQGVTSAREIDKLRVEHLADMDMWGNVLELPHHQ